MMKGNILYADCYTDLVTIDVGNPNAITIKNVIPDIFNDKLYWSGFYTNPGEVVTGFVAKDTSTDFEIPQGCAYFYGNRYIGNNVNLNDVVSNGSWPGTGNIFLTTAASGGTTATGKAGSMSRFALMNDYLYAVTNSTLHSIDVSSAANPVKMDSKGLGWNIETIYPFKDKLFIGSRNGMFIYEVSNPASPTYVSSFAHAELCDPVIVDGNYAYITLHSNGSNASGSIIGFCQGTRNEMNVVDVSNLASPSLVNTINLTQPKGLSKDGNTLIVCDGTDGLKVFNAMNPGLPVLQQTISLANSYDVICHNGIALVSAKDGLYQYSYSNPNNILKLSRFAF